MGEKTRRCRVCGCTDGDCRQCVEKTGEPCHWAEPDLCSACAGEDPEDDYFIDDDDEDYDEDLDFADDYDDGELPYDD
jgi:hypothetical protein